MAAPTPDIKMVKKVKTLRDKGLSFRQIGKLLNKDLKSVYRWHKFNIELSTPSRF